MEISNEGVYSFNQLQDFSDQAASIPNNSLIELKFYCQNLQDAHLFLLIDVIKKHHFSLSNLKFFLSGNDISPQGAKKIIELFTEADIQNWYLDLSFNQIGDEGAGFFAFMLQNPNVLDGTLNLSGNLITAEGAKHLAQGIKLGKGHLDNLKLYLGGNNIGDALLLAFADLLKDNHLPHHLFLDASGNGLTFSSMAPFALALKQTRVNGFKCDLRYNNLDGLSCQALGSALEKNEGTQGIELDLRDNKITQDDAMALAQSLRSNTSIVDLKLSLPPSHLLAIDYACLRNKLILQYPDLATFIKKESQKQGMYEPPASSTAASALSLKRLSSLFIFNEHLKVDKDRLPQELHDYLAELAGIQKQLFDTLTKKGLTLSR